MTYGGFWIRLVAKIIDGIVLAIFSGILGFGVGAVLSGAGAELAAVAGFLVQIAVGLAYTIFFIGKYAATPGKMALKLKVVTPDGGQVSYARAAGRALAEYVSAIILLIGYLIAAFDKEKRTLHDRIAGTRVVKG